jgi:hypothetical protein
MENNILASELPKVLEWYPKLTFNTEEGKKATEVQNRFFVMQSGNILTPEDNKKIVEERKWRMWVDNVYVHLLRYAKKNALFCNLITIASKCL